MTKIPIPRSLLIGLFASCMAYGQTHFSGEISRGQAYKTDIGRGLIFVLTPDESGWMISVVPAKPCVDGDDYAGVVTGPFRTYNPLYVDSAYGITAQQAVKEQNPRKIQFVLTCADYKREGDRLGKVLKPYYFPKREAEKASAEFGSSPQGEATFTILESRISPAEQAVQGKNYGKIDWLKWRLDIAVPKKNQANSFIRE